MGRGNGAAVDILYGDMNRINSVRPKLDLRRWHGAFEAGHLPSEMERILPDLEEALDVRLCCVWDRYIFAHDSDRDKAYSGNTELGILDIPISEERPAQTSVAGNPRLFSLPDDLHDWLYARAEQEPAVLDREQWLQHPILSPGERLVFANRNHFNALRR